MKDTTKTIIIGITATILVLAITIFILYKTSDKKELNNTGVSEKINNQNSNKLENNTSVTKEENNNINQNSENKNTESENIQKENTSNENTQNENTDSKVIIYLFHGATCPACQNALKNINEHKNTTLKNIEFRTFEIWNNSDNSKLMKLVANKLNVEARYIPYFIIGSYSKDGYNEETLLKEYKVALDNKNYKDIVAQVIKENPDLNPVYETLK